MNWHRVVLISSCLLACSLTAAAQETLSLTQALRDVLRNYPSLAVAQKQLARAQQENARVESQLGWNLAAQGGVSRNVSIVGSESDRIDAQASLSRRLKSGSDLSFDARYAYEDSEAAFSPLLPNPSETREIGMSYRQPWARGADNPAYSQGLLRAEQGVVIAEAERRAQYDGVARQLAELYYAAAATRARLRSAEQAIERSERLFRHVRYDARLGVSERKDLLQADAQLLARRAERDALRIAWAAQRTNMNRLMGRPWNQEFLPYIAESYPVLPEDSSDLKAQAMRHDPALARQQAQLRLAESAIALAEDERRNKLDVVYSLGAQNLSGDTTLGDRSNSTTIGGVRLEFGRSLDRRGVDAVLVQAKIDRDIAQENIRLASDDLHYQIDGLAAQIEANHLAVDSYRRSLAAEQAKMNEATRRYRTGRADTTQLIQFEADLYLAELALEQQLIELARKHSELEIIAGRLWSEASQAQRPEAPQ